MSSISSTSDSQIYNHYLLPELDEDGQDNSNSHVMATLKASCFRLVLQQEQI